MRDNNNATALDSLPFDITFGTDPTIAVDKPKIKAYLLAQSAKPGTGSDPGSPTPSSSAKDIWTAAAEGNIAAIQAHLDAGGDINAGNAHGETALHAAAYHNANEVIRFLVAAGARIDATNAARQTPLRLAEGHLICCTTFARHEEAARVLRELGADPNVGVQLTFGLTGFGDEASPSR